MFTRVKKIVTGVLCTVGVLAIAGGVGGYYLYKYMHPAITVQLNDKSGEHSNIVFNGTTFDQKVLDICKIEITNLKGEVNPDNFKVMLDSYDPRITLEFSDWEAILDETQPNVYKFNIHPILNIKQSNINDENYQFNFSICYNNKNGKLISNYVQLKRTFEQVTTNL